MLIEYVRKRDGRLEPFNPQKITNAILKALKATGEGDYELAEKLSREVVRILNQKYVSQIPSVEEIQDIVEDTLIRYGLVNSAKAYILYRRWRTSIRETKRLIGVEDDLKLTINAVRVLAKRYLLRDEQGRIIETPGQMFARVSKAVARADSFYGVDPSKSEKQFFQVMRNLEFLPNSPTLMNAGTEIGQLAACFVLPVEDSIDSIFDALKYMAIIHKSGGGTGFSFSKIRPKGDIVKSTRGVASGPVSFMKIFDVATEVIKQGGKRRGANMGILRVDHPDIREFITVKSDGVSLRNFNISVAVMDKFMEAVKSDGSIDLINPRTNEPVGNVSARDIFELIVDMAWRMGDPGLLFIDEINRKNPTPKLGEIEATNPCIAGNVRVLTPFGYIKVRELFKIAKQLNMGLLTTSGGVEGDGEPIAYKLPILVPSTIQSVHVTVNCRQVTLSEALLATAYVWKLAKKRIIKVETKEGYELKATPDHKVMTIDGWRKVSELKPGDKLLIAKIVLDNSYGSISIGEDLAFMLGKAIDGEHVDCHGVALTSNTPELNSGEPTQVLVLSNGNALLGRHNHAASLSSSVRRVKVITAKSIPEIVFRLKYNELASFLRGLFTACGYVGEDGTVRLASKYRSILRDLQELLLLFGIRSEVHGGGPSRIKIVNDHDKLKGFYELLIKSYDAKHLVEKVGLRNFKSLEVSFEGYESTYFATVKRVTDAGEEVVYDLTVPYFKNYVSSGFISHNCGEVPLLPFEACNLGSINLSKVVKNGDIDWDKLRELVWIGVHFLDNVIDVNKYPLAQIERMVKLNRKIGLGVMGFAEMLLKLGIPYDSNEALKIADKVMGFIASEGKKASRWLALERGVFPTFEESRWVAEGYDALRNATVTAIAPTGTISIIAGTSSSIEPIFAPVYVRRAFGGINLVEINPVFERLIRERGVFSRDLIVKVLKTGSLRAIPGVSEDVKRLMATALDIDPEWHVKIQAAFQRHVDNSVAKTVNLRHEAGLEAVRKVFMLAYELKCKGITVYRYGSKPEQVLYVGLEPGEETDVTLSMEYLEQCPRGLCLL